MLTERTLTIRAPGGAFPASLWLPAGAGPWPLVLMGHGGGGHRRSDHQVARAEEYGRLGCATAAIDAQGSGERAQETRDLGEAGIDGMVRDWTAALDALSASPDVDATRVGYGGVSLGTIYGLPFVAADQRIVVAVLGLAGAGHERGSPTPFAGRLLADAPRVMCPVLFLMQWDDELVERTGAFALFDRLGSAGKRLVAHPGGHGDVPASAADLTVKFMADALRAPR